MVEINNIPYTTNENLESLITDIAKKRYETWSL